MSALSHLPAIVTVKEAFIKLASAVTCFKEERPKVSGLGKFSGRLRKEIAVATELEQQVQKASVGQEKLVNRLQGLKNNLRGLSAEFETAKAVPGLVGISCTFPLLPPGAQHEVNAPKTVEVDIVAQNGHLWVEVKDSEEFGLGSTRWLGSQGHLSGLKQQAEARLQAASLPQNRRRWKDVTVLFHFPSGICSEIVDALRNLGVLISTVHPLQSACLPTPPPDPSVSNLDVTTLCALCSEVSHGGFAHPKVQAWARKAPHLAESLELEAREPVLELLSPFIGEDRQMIVSEDAMIQFNKLVSMFAGPVEQMRWEKLQQRLQVFSCRDVCAQSTRVDSMLDVASLTKAQRSVLSLGDAMHAVTLTANGRGIQSAQSQGVTLEAFVHRAAWLTGV